MVVQFTGMVPLMDITTNPHKELPTYFDHFQDRNTLEHQ